MIRSLAYVVLIVALDVSAWGASPIRYNSYTTNDQATIDARVQSLAGSAPGSITNNNADAVTLTNAGNQFAGNGAGLTNTPTAAPVVSLVNTSSVTFGTRGSLTDKFPTLSSALRASSRGDTLAIAGVVPIVGQATAYGISLVGSNSPLAILRATNLFGYSPALTLDKSVINNMIISNATAGDSSSYLLSVAPRSFGSVLFSTFYTPDAAFTSISSDQTGGQVLFYHDTFYAGARALDLWHGQFEIEHCTFFCTNTCISFNDDAVSRVQECFFQAGGANASAGNYHFLRSQSYLKNCIFKPLPNTPTNFVWVLGAEPNQVGPPTMATYEDCTFYIGVTNGSTYQGMVQLGSCYSSGQGSYVNVPFKLLNCNYSPATTNVIFDNGPTTIYVSGGNLLPCNFSTPANVVWISPVKYESPLIAQGVTNITVLSHNLSRVPDRYQVFVRCVVNDSSTGMVAGEETPVESFIDNTSGFVPFVSCVASPTSLWVHTENFKNGTEFNYSTLLKTGAGPASPGSWANYRLIVRAWLFQ